MFRELISLKNSEVDFNLPYHEIIDYLFEKISNKYPYGDFPEQWEIPWGKQEKVYKDEIFFLVIGKYVKLYDR